jgi:hypothetical protein
MAAPAAIGRPNTTVRGQSAVFLARATRLTTRAVSCASTEQAFARPSRPSDHRLTGATSAIGLSSLVLSEENKSSSLRIVRGEQHRYGRVTVSAHAFTEP